MAAIKAIEARSVHQIQSGQVIIDICSVVKELVENSLDAGATSIEIRFKNNGLDSIEVQDNGVGISPENYESVALKHHTSKLSTYEDLESLRTFGFRGEALSSLCALSSFHMITAREQDAPKGTKLDFDVSGKLKSTSVKSSQKGTIVVVEKLFASLPVRRRELEKNIKREYGKVLGLLHAYACINTGVKFRVQNQMPKAKTSQVFHTNANQTTKENIANVYGAKTLVALMPLDLELEFEPSRTQRPCFREDGPLRKIVIAGHISRPVFGEGRQTPDRQMFFVNKRPCGLPQIAKAFNEVYKSFNVSQSPFIFADLKMDTNAYDVNVSPDKRTIALHDAGSLIESLKASLMDLFERQDQTVPLSQISQKLPIFKQLTIQRDNSTDSKASTVSANSVAASADGEESGSSDSKALSLPTTAKDRDEQAQNLIHDLLQRKRETQNAKSAVSTSNGETSESQENMPNKLDNIAGSNGFVHSLDDYDDEQDVQESGSIAQGRAKLSTAVRDFNSRLASQEAIARARRRSTTESTASKETDGAESEPPIPAIETRPTSSQPGVVQNAFDRMRPKRPAREAATISIGGKTTTTDIGRPASKRTKVLLDEPRPLPLQREADQVSLTQAFGRKLKSFAAPGTRIGDVSGDEESQDDELRPNRRVGGEDQPDEEHDDTEDRRNDHMVSDSEDLDGDSEHGEDLESAEDDESDEDYVDEKEKKREDEAKVQELIREAEENAARPSEDSTRRAATILKGGIRRDVTTNLATTIGGSISRIDKQLRALKDTINHVINCTKKDTIDDGIGFEEAEAEERLSLTISKSDFAAMRIIGQFNLGFILATRSSGGDDSAVKDDLFIIDQHASDEKYNFERLQASTVVQNQRLVKPLALDLTAVEEEIIIENIPALERNGFLVEIDTSENAVTGHRCKLVSLPLSKEVVFNTRDFEELIALLSEAPTFGEEGGLRGNSVPRPTKVRRMFAMRACRSSVMIGKTLTEKRMAEIVRHMGTIDKPWNCPHGRPTMRHIVGLDGWGGWREGDGLGVEEGQDVDYGEFGNEYSGNNIWARYIEENEE